MTYSLLALCVFAAGCTASHVVTLSHLESKHPVSASPEYLDGEGTIVASKDYQVVWPFLFTKEERADSAHFESTLHLGSELDRLVQIAKGDAVTNLRVEATSFETHENAASILGLSLEVLGAILLVPAVMSLDDQDEKLSPVFWASAGCLAGGGLLYLVGDLTKPTSWQFRVTGQVVRSRPTRPASPAAPAASSAPSEPY